MANIRLHTNDLADNVTFKGDIAIDTEAMGLNNHRDRLCVVQLSDGNGDAHIVHFPDRNYTAPRLKALLTDAARTKIFHYARFDVAILKQYLGVKVNPIYCTKIASRLARTYTDSHGLKDLCRDLAGAQISKQQQSSDWGAETLTEEQLHYAASDVLYLHTIRERLNAMLEREGRKDLAHRCFAFLETRVELDLAGWPDLDIFAH
ncbi:MAG: ribonuclease [Rickettsiales bacterium]|jgi:ribonuclease D|nr:ribonuclease [Rickettsiales bacterium]